MTSTATTRAAETAPPTRLADTIAAALKRWALVIAAFVLVYTGTITGLVSDWMTNEDYSHGLLIPFAIAYLLYDKREELRALPLRPSGWGLAIIVFSQIVYLVGFLGAEFFLQRSSMVLFAAGAVVFAAGWRHLLHTAFAFVLFLMAIPLPSVIFNVVALPLQLLASSWAESFLSLCRVPVYREGNVLQLSTQMLNVAEACSGIRSLVSLFSLGMMLAYFLPLRWWARVLFVATTVPIALVTNAFRVAGTGVLAVWWGPEAAEGFFHTFSGWIVFVIAFVILLGELLLLQRFVRKEGREGAQA